MSLSEARDNRAKNTEKDIGKIEVKVKRSEEAGERISVNLSSTAKSLEEARLAWEGSVYKYARGA